MEMNDYQEAARTTAIYPPDQALNYLVPALAADRVRRVSYVAKTGKQNA